ncbi:MAG: hypothetical protein FJ135_02185 [Deltaproteobacteria bacterium]|nr:hypothetical protein [Deltaproteobacteria bacterium]
MDWLSGKKTYLVAVFWGAAVSASLAGWITGEQLSVVEAILLPLGLASLRAGIKGIGERK